MDQVPGEIKVLEADWDSPESFLFNHHLMYAGEAQESDQSEVEGKLNHTHQVQDSDDPEFWNNILKYLNWKRLLKNQDEANRIK